MGQKESLGEGRVWVIQWKRWEGLVCVEKPWREMWWVGKCDRERVSLTQVRLCKGGKVRRSWGKDLLRIQKLMV